MSLYHDINPFRKTGLLNNGGKPNFLWLVTYLQELEPFYKHLCSKIFASYHLLIYDICKHRNMGMMMMMMITEVHLSSVLWNGGEVRCISSFYQFEWGQIFQGSGTNDWLLSQNWGKEYLWIFENIFNYPISLSSLMLLLLLCNAQ